MQTYSVAQPLVSHFRPATCKEVDCEQQRLGWMTLVDERIGRGKAQAHYIRRQSERHFREEQLEGGMTAFVFEAGQECFKQHQMPLEREPFFFKTQGDWRRYLGRPRPMRGQDWLDDFATHQLNLKEKLGG